jgi:hypothetical protein
MFQEWNPHVSQKLSVCENFYMLSGTIIYVIKDAGIMVYSTTHRTTEVVKNHYKCCSTTVVSKLHFYVHPPQPHMDWRKFNEGSLYATTV